MGGYHHYGSASRDILKNTVDGLSRSVVELRGGFVDKKEVRFGRERPDKHQPLGLPAGQTAIKSACRIRKFKLLEQFECLRFGRGALHSTCQKWERGMVEGRSTRDSMWILEHPPRPVDRSQVNFTEAGRNSSRNDTEECALSYPRRSN